MTPADPAGGRRRWWGWLAAALLLLWLAAMSLVGLSPAFAQLRAGAALDAAPAGAVPGLPLQSPGSQASGMQSPGLQSTALQSTSPAASFRWRFGWSELPPFEFRETADDGEAGVAGMDAVLLRLVVEQQLGGRLRTESDPAPVDVLIERLRQGELDVLTAMEGRRRQRAFARFSDPYRYDEMVVVVPQQTPGRWLSMGDPAALRRGLERDRRARVGVLRGWFYGKPLQALLDDPAQAERVVAFASPAELLAAVGRGRVDLGLAERVTVAHLIWPARQRYPLLVAERPFQVMPARFMFNARTVSDAQVRRFNSALAEVKRSGAFHRVVRSSLLPLLLQLTAEQWWFRELEKLGVFAAALTGSVLAIRAGMSVTGILILAMATGVGGGLLRDVVINRPVPTVVQQPVFLALVYGAVLLVLLVGQLRFAWLLSPRLDRWLDGFDALGIAAFTVTGVLIALRMQVEPLLLWGPMLSVLTAGGGMLVREFIRGRGEGLLQRGVLYHEITFGCSLLLSLVLVGYSERETYRVQDLELAVILTMALVMLIRLTAIQRGWRSPGLGADRLRRSAPISDPEPPADPPDRESRCR